MTAVERVARGAALLDEQRPGWWERITATLEIAHPCKCVLGQVLDSELKGIGTGYDLGLFLFAPKTEMDDEEPLDRMEAAASWSTDHGFLYLRGFPASEVLADIRALEAEWLRVIAERRASVTP